uniref:MOB kinase activator 1B n=1 Tax=Pavo cristatus TaxID=9049 RepID=A0A8C9F9T1_PAVCR
MFLEAFIGHSGLLKKDCRLGLEQLQMTLGAFGPQLQGRAVGGCGYGERCRKGVLPGCVRNDSPVLRNVFFLLSQPRYEYHWADGTNIKKPIKCSAPKYIDYLMTWVQDQLDDETLFPSKIGVPFPKNFMSVAKTILKRLFRVYAHIYHQHFDPVIQLQEEAHLNTSFKHFIFFVQEFNLIDRRELAPLQELIEKLTSKDR